MSEATCSQRCPHCGNPAKKIVQPGEKIAWCGYCGGSFVFDSPYAGPKARPSVQEGRGRAAPTTSGHSRLLNSAASNPSRDAKGNSDEPSTETSSIWPSGAYKLCSQVAQVLAAVAVIAAYLWYLGAKNAPKPVPPPDLNSKVSLSERDFIEKDRHVVARFLASTIVESERRKTDMKGDSYFARFKASVDAESRGQFPLVIRRDTISFFEAMRRANSAEGALCAATAKLSGAERERTAAVFEESEFDLPPTFEFGSEEQAAAYREYCALTVEAMHALAHIFCDGKDDFEKDLSVALAAIEEEEQRLRALPR